MEITQNDMLEYALKNCNGEEWDRLLERADGSMADAVYWEMIYQEAKRNEDTAQDLPQG
jgi:hypothetical protein